MKVSASTLSRLPLFTALCCLLACLIHLFPGATALLEYNRSGIADGQIWRLITGHWTHWSGEHLLWDLLTLACLGLVGERGHRIGFLITLIGASLTISLDIWQFSPQAGAYRGLSGLVSALFLYTAGTVISEKLDNGQHQAAFLAALATLAFMGKVAYETITSATLFVEPGSLFTPMPVTHLVGGLTGGFIALAGWFFSHEKDSEPFLHNPVHFMHET